jgi:hypothetical protein
MDAVEKGSTSLCKKLHELPPLITDWQQPVWCLDCDDYSNGQCRNPMRRDGNAACPFDGRELPLREVVMETPMDQSRSPLNVRPGRAQAGQPRFEALEQAIRLSVRDRTGGRIQALAIELTDRELVLRGTAPCYYVKQLALHAALDVLRSACEIAADLKLDVDVVPPAARPWVEDDYVGESKRSFVRSSNKAGVREEWQ